MVKNLKNKSLYNNLKILEVYCSSYSLFNL